MKTKRSLNHVNRSSYMAHQALVSNDNQIIKQPITKQPKNHMAWLTILFCVLICTLVLL